MSMFFTKSSEVEQFVQENFGKSDNYLVAIKSNGFVKGLLKLLLNNLYYTLDSSRSFVLYFDDKGVHEKEISLTDNASFLFIPWREVTDFNVRDKEGKAFIDINHLGKTYSYEIGFNDKLLKGNRGRFIQLCAHNFYRESC